VTNSIADNSELAKVEEVPDIDPDMMKKKVDPKVISTAVDVSDKTIKTSAQDSPTMKKKDPSPTDKKKTGTLFGDPDDQEADK